jgi:hypothetical protein
MRAIHANIINIRVLKVIRVWLKSLKGLAGKPQGFRPKAIRV